MARRDCCSVCIWFDIFIRFVHSNTLFIWYLRRLLLTEETLVIIRHDVLLILHKSIDPSVYWLIYVHIMWSRSVNVNLLNRINLYAWYVQKFWCRTQHAFPLQSCTILIHILCASLYAHLRYISKVQRLFTFISLYNDIIEKMKRCMIKRRDRHEEISQKNCVLSLWSRIYVTHI